MIPWRLALAGSGWRTAHASHAWHASHAHLVADAVLSPEECEDLIAEQGLLRPSFEAGRGLLMVGAAQEWTNL